MDQSEHQKENNHKELGHWNICDPYVHNNKLQTLLVPILKYARKLIHLLTVCIGKDQIAGLYYVKFTSENAQLKKGNVCK